MRDRLVAPQGDGESSTVPARRDWPALASSPLAFSAYGILNAEWRAETQRAARAFANDYLAGLGEIPPEWAADGPLVVAGHQPELFHPGVWAKNFAATGLARELGGAALHVMTDNDTAKSLSLTMPGGTPAEPFLAQLPLDAWTGETPWEGRTVVDPARFAAFGPEAERCLSGFAYQPVIAVMWPAVRNSDPRLSLGERLAIGRRLLERKLGGGMAEATLSGLARSLVGYAAFLADLISRAEEFAAAHDEALAEYRKRHGIRSAHHPAADLETRAGEVELPLWIWSETDPRRRRPFVRKSGDRLTMTVDGEPVAVLPAEPQRLTRALHSGLGEWLLRPRALATTAFLRLGVADLFIHGIGGGEGAFLGGAAGRATPPAWRMAGSTRAPPVFASADSSVLR